MLVVKKVQKRKKVVVLNLNSIVVSKKTGAMYAVEANDHRLGSKNYDYVGVVTKQGYGLIVDADGARYQYYTDGSLRSVIG